MLNLQRERKIEENMRKNEDMYKLYDEYKKSLKVSKKALLKRQKLNAEIREKYEEPFGRRDYNDNKSDITNWNSMIRDLEDGLKGIEQYLDYEDRYYLHKECDDMRSAIYNQNSYEGLVPLETMYGASIPDTTDIVCDVELQEEIVDLLDEVLTERQRQVVEMYFWDEMTMEQISRKMGLDKSNVSRNLQNALDLLRKRINIEEFVDFL